MMELANELWDFESDLLDDRSQMYPLHEVNPKSKCLSTSLYA